MSHRSPHRRFARFVIADRQCVNRQYFVKGGTQIRTGGKGFADPARQSKNLANQAFKTLDCLPTLNRALDRGGIHRGDRTLKGAVFGAIVRSLNRALETQEIFKDTRHPDQIQPNIDHGRRPAPSHQ